MKTKKTRTIFGIIAILAIIGLIFTACGDGESKPVKDIKFPGGMDLELPLGKTFDLSQAKFYLDDKEDSGVTIEWKIKDAKGTGATVSGSTLTAGETSIGSNYGEVILTATAAGQDCSRDFHFWLRRWDPDSKTLYFTADKGDDWGNWSTGDSYPFPPDVSLVVNKTYNVYIEVVSSSLAGEEMGAYFINNAPPTYYSDLTFGSTVEPITNGNLAISVDTMKNGSMPSDSSYNRISFTIHKGSAGIADADVGKVMGKLTYSTLTVTQNP